MEHYTAIAIVVGTVLSLCIVLLFARDKYYSFVEGKISKIIGEFHTSERDLGVPWTAIDFVFCTPFMFYGAQRRIVLYILASERRRFLNKIGLIAFLCSLFSIFFPIYLLLFVINFHNNVFKYP